MSLFVRLANALVDWKGDNNGTAQVGLFAPNGNPSLILPNTTPALPSGLIVLGLDEFDRARAIRFDTSGRNRLNRDTQLFTDPIEGATIDTLVKWTQTLTTFTNAQVATTGLNTNSGAVNTSGGISSYVSLPQFPRAAGNDLRNVWRIRFNWQAGSQFSLGFGSAPGLTVTNGAFMRIRSDGTVEAGFSSNTSETTSTIGSFAGLGFNVNNYYWVSLVWRRDSIQLVIGDGVNAPLVDTEIAVAVAAMSTISATHAPIFFHHQNISATSSPANMFVAAVEVYASDIDLNLPLAFQMARSGRSLWSSPTAFTQLANYANAAAPASATLSSAAAGYTTAGGQWQFVAVAGAETDYNLFNFTCPAPYGAFITGIKISAFNLGAANSATVPTLLQWGLGLHGTTADLSTGLYQRILIGTQTIPINALVGETADRDVEVTFDTPYYVFPNRRFSLILKIPVGAATASQVIRGTALIKGFFH